MRQIKIPYGKSEIALKIKNEIVDIIEKKEKRNKKLSQKEIKDKIKEFIKILSLEEKKNIAIAIPDITRPKIPEEFLRLILENLLNNFQGNIKIFVGTGLHSFKTSDINLLIPKEFKNNQRLKVYFHNAKSENNVYIGKTKRDTPVFIEKEYYTSDLKIVIGVVEPHQFAGFSGGAKGAVIGLGGEQTISKNHSLILDFNSKIGKIVDNPLREDIDEAGKIIGVDFLINIIMNNNNEIMELFCGQHPYSHREAVKYIENFIGVPIEKKYDLVIASPGGFPRDIDLYQAQKALTTAHFFCKSKGSILLVAECSRGIGEKSFLDLIKRFKSPELLVKNFDFDNFKVGPHKALIFAKLALNNELFLYSENVRDELKGTFITPIKDLKRFIEDFGEDKEICILPKAIQILPLEGGSN